MTVALGTQRTADAPPCSRRPSGRASRPRNTGRGLSRASPIEVILLPQPTQESLETAGTSRPAAPHRHAQPYRRGPVVGPVLLVEEDPQQVLAARVELAKGIPQPLRPLEADDDVQSVMCFFWIGIGGHPVGRTLP